MTGDDLAYQDAILQGVSRTFALTIPLLPRPLRDAVGTAYLLCRIADTIEDSATLDAPDKQDFSEWFSALTAGEREDGDAFAYSLTAKLGVDSLDAERDLVTNTPRVLRLLNTYGETSRVAMARCVRIMCDGMSAFQERHFTRGVPDMEELARYCYHVAGVVGEMLTDLFCAHSPAIAAKRDTLSAYAVSFGQGLQMTNILKDIWDDRARGVCWLPQDVFTRHGFDLEALGKTNPNDPAFDAGLYELIGVATGHLLRALKYAMEIPASETGIRRFCLLPIGLAILTLRNIGKHPRFDSGRDVKISRRSVAAMMLATRLFYRSNKMIGFVFYLGVSGLWRNKIISAACAPYLRELANCRS